MTNVERIGVACHIVLVPSSTSTLVPERVPFAAMSVVPPLPFPSRTLVMSTPILT